MIPWTEHERYMLRALELARQQPELPFAAVLVSLETGKTIAEGINHTSDGPIWHGELDAIQRGSLSLADKDWRSVGLYTTAEPCPMCAGAALWAGLGMVVFGTSIPFLKEHGWWQVDLRAADIFDRVPDRHCQLVGGVLRQHSDGLFARK